VLIVDDDHAVADVVREAIVAAFSEIRCDVVCSFAEAESVIAARLPDALVLDLIDDANTSEHPGERTWRGLWEKDAFCPIVIYSAWAGDLTPPVPGNHPFVQRIKKGKGTEAQVVEGLKKFAPAIAAIASLHSEVHQVIQRVLRDAAGSGLLAADPSTLVHAGRRRLAAAMDEPTTTDLKSWEQYLVPPIGDSPRTGDVLKRRGSVGQATDFRLILTPSCDLVRDRKTCPILVAKCEPFQALLAALSLPAKKSDARDRLIKQALSQGVFNGWIPLPAFSGLIPHLAANLKNLEVIPYDSVGPETPQGETFDRVASIDSPFREQVSWALLTTLARPGMPERDLQSWATEILPDA